MGYIIGSDPNIKTWGSIRRAMTQAITPFQYVRNTVYPDNSTFFKTEEGSGMMKTAIDFSSFTIANPIIWLNPSVDRLEARNIDERYKTQIIGLTVTNDLSETVVIDAAAFVPPNYQTVALTSTLITDITDFDPIT